MLGLVTPSSTRSVRSIQAARARGLRRAHARQSSTVFLARKLTESAVANRNQYPNVYRMAQAYQQYGHLEADLNPLSKRLKTPLSSKATRELLAAERFGLTSETLYQEIPLDGIVEIPGQTTATVNDVVNQLKNVYCSHVGVEIAHLEVKEQEWLRKQIETRLGPNAKLEKNEKLRIADLLLRAENLDRFLGTKFASLKRYSLEGNESLVVALDTIFNTSTKYGVEYCVLAMAHRGRLNTLTELLEYPHNTMFAKIMGKSLVKEDEAYTDDVLSHIAVSHDASYDGKNIHISLLNNPSHLEAANPVAIGKTRAAMDLANDKKGSKTLCVTVHGDAAMKGQGIVSETVEMSSLAGYTVGGTVHVVTNNQIGFTANPRDGRSSRYCTDVAKSLGFPVLHVNSDHPELVKICSEIAVEYRSKFHKDVFVDIIGYRRHGHNELDEPMFTQPIMYSAIREQPSVVKTYVDGLKEQGLLDDKWTEQVLERQNQIMQKAHEDVATYKPNPDTLKGQWSTMTEPTDITVPVKTGVSVDILKKVGKASVDVGSAQVHNRLEKLFIKGRVENMDKPTNEKVIDWPTAEALAFGSILLEGTNIRMSGQDSSRGTFSHRHMKLTDQKSGVPVTPLNSIQENQGKLHLYSSFLSENAVMSFEYGYSLHHPNALVLWEAQFGDFFNGAQVVIDTFVSSSEAKWMRQTGLVLLLPHGYDGAGPEHSSARVERFLQLSDSNAIEDTPKNKNPNWRVIYPSNAANYFHALRRQVATPYRKPLVVVGPKTLLRSQDAQCALDDLAEGTHFLPVIGDKTAEAKAKSIKKVVFCSGKIAFDLEKKRSETDAKVAIVRVEELVPFPTAAIAAELAKYPKKVSVQWAQEEPQNQGAWTFVEPRFRNLVDRTVSFVGRPPLPAPEYGSGTTSKIWQDKIINDAMQV